jgi:DUF4097 and DUF4098 domain-containing protein YvlB
MADNPATQPAKVQYQPPRRSFAGPVILVIVGVLLLMGTMHTFAWRDLLHYFARYWPLLIIFWGLVKMIEYSQDRAGGRPTRGVGAGGFVLLFFLIVIGLAATGLDRFNWSALRSELGTDEDLGVLFGNTYDFTQELQQDFPANAALRVVADRGDITVNAWDQPKIKVVVRKKIVSGTEDEAKRTDESSRPALTFEGTTVVLDARPTGGRAVRDDLEIYIPKKAAVDLTTRRGDVTTRGRQGDVTVAASRGDVVVQDVTGNATVNIGRGSALGRGSVQVSNVTGDVRVSGLVSDIKVSDIGGSARLEGEYFGSIEISKVAKAVSLRTSVTEMDFAKLDGDLNLDSGDLRANGIAGPVRLVTHASKDIHLDDVSGAVTVDNRSGTLEIHAGKLPLGAMELSTRNGDVQLVLPAKAAFDVEARATRGDITSDYPGLKIDTSSPRESRASGSVGNGGPRIVINDEHGNIEIRKAG